MFSRNQLASFTVALGFTLTATACSGTSSPISPSAVDPSGTNATSSQGGSLSPAGGGSSADSGLIRVRCEFRAGRRSKVSVDGNNLPAGTYTARVQSGANIATSPARAAVGDEVEFDFDSNPDNIAAGATPIARNFLASGSVAGEIVNASGAVVASDTVTCRIR